MHPNKGNTKLPNTLGISPKGKFDNTQDYRGMNFIGRRRKAKIIVHEQTKSKIHNRKTEKKSVMKTKPR